MYRYVMWGDIQRILEKYKAQGLSFYDAFKIAEKEAAKEAEHISFPDFESWDCSDAGDLFELFMKVPVIENNVGDRPLLLTMENEDHAFFRIKERYQIAPISRFESLYYNADWFSVFYIMSGDAVLYIEDDPIRLAGGTVSMIAPHVSHRFCGGPECVAIEIMIWEKQFEDIFSKVLQHRNILTDYYTRFLENEHVNSLHFRLAEQKIAYYLIRDLLKEHYSANEYSGAICTSLIELFILLAVRDHHGAIKDRIRVRKRDLTVPEVLRYIHDNYSTVTLEAAAMEFGYTSGHLSSILKQSTGKSFQTLVTEEKMREAEYLLKYTGLSLEEVSHNLGYESFSGFSRKFTSFMGISPGKYRSQFSVYER